MSSSYTAFGYPSSSPNLHPILLVKLEQAAAIPLTAHGAQPLHAGVRQDLHVAKVVALTVQHEGRQPAGRSRFFLGCWGSSAYSSGAGLRSRRRCCLCWQRSWSLMTDVKRSILHLRKPSVEPSSVSESPIAVRVAASRASAGFLALRQGSPRPSTSRSNRFNEPKPLRHATIGARQRHASENTSRAMFRVLFRATQHQKQAALAV